MVVTLNLHLSLKELIETKWATVDHHLLKSRLFKPDKSVRRPPIRFLVVLVCPPHCCEQCLVI